MDTILDVNFKAYVHLTSHALPTLSENKGRIIVMDSLSGMSIHITMSPNNVLDSSAHYFLAKSAFKNVFLQKSIAALQVKLESLEFNLDDISRFKGVSYMYIYLETINIMFFLSFSM